MPMVSESESKVLGSLRKYLLQMKELEQVVLDSLCNCNKQRAKQHSAKATRINFTLFKL